MNPTDTLPDSAVSTSWILGLQALPGHIDPAATALQWVGGRRTYAELRDRALRLAGWLRERGLQPGDRVATHLFNRGETFEVYFACAYAGLVLVPISFRLTEHEIAFIVDDSSPGVILTEIELRPVLEAGLARAESSRPFVIELEGDLGGAEYETLFAGGGIAEISTSEIQMLLYTSGTTGRPKGVEMRQGNIMWTAMQQATFYAWMTDHPTTMLTGPMYNTAALNEQSIPTFLVGGTVAIMPSRGWKPRRMAELMTEWTVTHALIYPSMMEPMLADDDEEQLPLDSLRFVLTGGENCPPALMRRFKERWPRPMLCVAYGSTESGIITLLRDEEIWVHPGSVGRPAGAQSVAVVDPVGRPVTPGDVGEIVTAGPGVVRGYWNAPELTASAFVGTWLKLGDLGRMDADGYLYIEGRSKDMIISKGQNIYPAEIENVLREHSAVLDASVVGVPDSEAGEAVCACIVSKAGAPVTAHDIRSFVQERLASYKKPKHVIFIEAMPRNPSGKVLKADLVRTAVGHIEGVDA